MRRTFATISGMFVLSLFVQAQDPDFAGWPAEQQRRWEEINAGGNDFELQQRLNQAEQNRIQRERNLSEALAEIAGKMQQQGNGGGQRNTVGGITFEKWESPPAPSGSSRQTQRRNAALEQQRAARARQASQERAMNERRKRIEQDKREEQRRREEARREAERRAAVAYEYMRQEARTRQLTDEAMWHAGVGADELDRTYTAYNFARAKGPSFGYSRSHVRSTASARDLFSHVVYGGLDPMAIPVTSMPDTAFITRYANAMKELQERDILEMREAAEAVRARMERLREHPLMKLRGSVSESNFYLIVANMYAICGECPNFIGRDADGNYCFESPDSNKVFRVSRNGTSMLYATLKEDDAGLTTKASLGVGYNGLEFGFALKDGSPGSGKGTELTSSIKHESSGFSLTSDGEISVGGVFPIDSLDKRSARNHDSAGSGLHPNVGVKGEINYDDSRSLDVGYTRFVGITGTSVDGSIVATAGTEAGVYAKADLSGAGIGADLTTLSMGAEAAGMQLVSFGGKTFVIVGAAEGRLNNSLSAGAEIKYGGEEKKITLKTGPLKWKGRFKVMDMDEILVRMGLTY